MTELLTAAQMRAIEQAAIDSGEVTGLELMERAGRGVVEAIFEEWPEYRNAPQSTSVLCGPGNNGGDGFVVARLLAELGWTVQVFHFGNPEELPADAKANYFAWLGIGSVLDGDERTVRNAAPTTLYVDALFGAGLNRAPNSGMASVLRHFGGYGGDNYCIVSIDTPSGLCLDSGRVLDGAKILSHADSVPRASLTVTFDSPKSGHFIADGPACCGKLVVSDIGLKKWRQVDFGKENRSRRIRLPRTNLVRLKPLVSDSRFYFTDIVGVVQKESSNKFHHGHALILSGPATKTGAARLAARGALRIGAGLVTIGSPTSALAEHAAQLNAIMLTGIEDAVTLREVLKDERITSLCLGPGMGLTDVTREMVEVALTSKKKCVLDADALTVFQVNPQHLFDMLHENVVLTPHGGEFARLFPDISARLNQIATIGPAYSKLDATRDAAARAGCVVLFKGPDTVIADPQGRAAINSAHYERSAPWLATAGSGDVLAGFIAGLMARGLPAMTAAESAAWLHVECALKFGAGLIAEDLPEQLPAVFAALQL